MVKNVKHHLKREVPTTKSDIKLNITTFLTIYQNIPHTVTNQAPADLILKQTPRTRLSLTSPNINLRIKTQLQSKSHQQKEAKTREFCVDDPVLVRDLLSGQPTKWQTGTVTEVLGGPRYLVNLGENTPEKHMQIIYNQVYARTGLQLNQPQKFLNNSQTVPLYHHLEDHSEKRFSKRDY